MERFRPGAIDWRGLVDRFWSTSRINRVALGAGALWAVLVLSYAGGYFGGSGGQARGTAFLDAVFFLVALLLPLGLVALAAWLAAELARQRAAVGALVEAAGPLIAALEETRGSLAQDGPLAPKDVDRLVRGALAQTRAELVRDIGAALSGPLGEVRDAQRRLETAVQVRPAAAAPAETAAVERTPSRLLARPALTRPRPPEAAPPEAEEEGQPALPDLAGEPEEPLAWEDLVRALDFPRDEADQEGFAALRRALRHHSLQKMLQAAEDVMNLMAQEGVFMDDLEHRPGPAWARRRGGRGGRRAGPAGARRGAEPDADGPDLPRRGPDLPAPLRRRARRAGPPCRRCRPPCARRHPLGPRLPALRPRLGLVRLSRASQGGPALSDQAVPPVDVGSPAAQSSHSPR